MHQWLISCHSPASLADLAPLSRILRWILSLLVCGCLLGSLSPYCRAADPAAPGGDRSGEPLHINADRFSHDLNRNETTAQGDVTLTFRNLTLKADQVSYNRTSYQAWAMGHVRLLSGQDTLTGDRLSLNLQQETGTLFNGSIFIAENHVYLTADEIRKTGLQTYAADQATITTCDGPEPDWRITGQRVKVTLEGYGTAWHTAFWAGKVPLIYSPYFIFPAKTKRQSGLLIPELAYSESRKGFEYRQPFFWAIGDSSDATFYSDIMSLRGLQFGAEYRYALSPASFGTLMAGGMHDQEVDDGRPTNTERWGYSDDGYLRPNNDRYWLRAKADQQLPGDILAKLDLDWVSDQDYLHEFRNGRFGFSANRQYFRETFGRDLDDEHDIIRTNQLNLNKTWRRFSANGDLRWNDHVVQRRQQNMQDTIQQLPALQFSAVKQPVAGLPVYYFLDTGYDYFYRQDGADAHRADIRAAAAYPLRLFERFSMESTAGLRQTFWSAESDDPSSDPAPEQFQRTLYDFSVNLNTEPYRIYQSTLAGGDRLKHIIKPQLGYQYVSDPDQDKLPYFDYEDRVVAQNRLTFGLTNTLISRMERPTAAAQAPTYRYLPVLRFNVEGGYNLNEPGGDNNARPFSDILAELDLTPGHTIAIDADTTWSPYDHTFDRFDLALHLFNKRRDRLDITYSSRRSSDLQNLILSGGLQLTSSWRLRAAHERNLQTDTAIESRIGISYLSQCWALDLDYIEETQDRSIAVIFYLTGLGKIGG